MSTLFQQYLVFIYIYVNTNFTDESKTNEFTGTINHYDSNLIERWKHMSDN